MVGDGSHSIGDLYCNGGALHTAGVSFCIGGEMWLNGICGSLNDWVIELLAQE